MDIINQYLYKYKYTISLIIVLIIISLLSYKIIFSNRTNSKLINFEKKYIKNIKKNQIDFCSDSYKRSNVSE